MQIPENLQRLRQYDTGARWLARLPQLVSELVGAWELRLSGPGFSGDVSYVVPALRGDAQVVLKVQWPHDECAHEADALRVWNGDGAVRLLAHDATRHALLLEHCRPGTHLAQATGIDPIAILIELLPRLWKQAGPPFKSLADEARGWRATLHANWEAAGRPCERRLVDAAAEFIDQLADDQGEPVLVHQDLHGDNVLAAEREPWLAIDPKPLAGEREFSLAPVVRSFEYGHSQAQVIRRLDRLCAELRQDRQRVCRWTIAQTIAWSFDSAYAARHYETVRWLMTAV
jgi:streptomycin 6-kinase